MTTPTISEAARRAAWKAYATAMNRMTDGLNYDADKPPHEESIAMKEALQAAIDSAHPAPKEGDINVVLLARQVAKLATETHGNYQLVCDCAHATFEPVISQLELRLSEAQSAIETWKQTAFKDREENVDLRNELAEAKREMERLKAMIPPDGETLASALRELQADYDQVYRDKTYANERREKYRLEADSLRAQLEEKTQEAKALRIAQDLTAQELQAARIELIPTRSHLKTANELLGRINGFVEDDHITPSLRNEIVTHLLRQTGTTKANES